MPELPDVEVFRRYAASTSLNRSIKRLELTDQALLRVSKQQLKKGLEGSNITETGRHGKYAFLGTGDGQWLVLHFGMTGFLQFSQEDEANPHHSHLIFHFADDTKLAYSCMRKLGEINITRYIAGFVQQKELGPDAFAIKREEFFQLMEGKRGMLKSAMMDQSFIAGMGNINTDEACFQAGIHPKSRIPKLGKEVLNCFFDAMKEVLQTAIDCNAQPDDMPSSFLLPHRKPGATFDACQGEVEKIKVSNRSTYFCPKMQKLYG